MPQTIDYDTYEMPSGTGNFLKLENGDNKIRLANKPLELRVHDTSVKGGKFETKLCQGEGCELCKQGKKLQFKYAYLVLSRKDGKPYIYEAPITVFKQILAYATDAEYGDPTQYDLNIKRSGEKPQITYQVVASPKKSELTEAETALLAEAQQPEDVYKDKE